MNYNNQYYNNQYYNNYNDSNFQPITIYQRHDENKFEDNKGKEPDPKTYINLDELINLFDYSIYSLFHLFTGHAKFHFTKIQNKKTKFSLDWCLTGITIKDKTYSAFAIEEMGRKMQKALETYKISFYKNVTSIPKIELINGLCGLLSFLGNKISEVEFCDYGIGIKSIVVNDQRLDRSSVYTMGLNFTKMYKS